MEIGLVVIARSRTAASARNPAFVDLSTVSRTVGYHHVLGLDVIVLMNRVIHCSIDEFDELPARLGRIATRSNLAFSVPDGPWSAAPTMAVAATATVGNRTRLAPNVQAVTVDEYHRLQQVDGL